MFNKLKNFVSTTIMVVVSFVMFSCFSSAQLPKESIGINSSFGYGSSYANLVYVVEKNIEIGGGLMFDHESVSYSGIIGKEDPDPETTLGINVFLRYYLKKGNDVSPYIGGSMGYVLYPTETDDYDDYSYETDRNLLNFNFFFGGQAFLAKNFAVFGQIGISLNVNSNTVKRIDPSLDTDEASTTRMNIGLFTSNIGASFYF